MENRGLRAVSSEIRRIKTVKRCAACVGRSTEAAQRAAMGI